MSLVTRGAGRIDVLSAATSLGSFGLPIIEFGLDDLDQPQFTKQLQVPLVNLSDKKQAFSLEASHALPAGAVVRVTPETVELDPGASAEVTVTLEVDNEIVPNAPDDPFSYQGALVATPGEGEGVFDVPFAFYKAAAIDLSFAEEPFIVNLRSTTGFEKYVSWPGTKSRMLVREGEYFIYAHFINWAEEKQSYIFREGVSVECHHGARDGPGRRGRRELQVHRQDRCGDQ